MLDLTAVLLTIIVVAVSASIISRKWRWSQVEKLPGHVALPLLGTTYVDFFTKREDRIRSFDEVCKKFGPIFRLWLGPYPVVQISKPEYMEKVLSSSEIIDKSHFYVFLYPWLGQGLLTSTGSKWHMHRKMITPAFHFRILDNFVEIFAENGEILVEKLKPQADGKAFDIYPFITRCALDIICETAMGTSVNAQNQTQSAYVNAVTRISELTVERMINPWMQSDFIFERTSSAKEYYDQLKILHGFTKKVIAERKSARKTSEFQVKAPQDDDLGRKRRVAFLDLLLDASEDGQKLDDQELQEEVDTFMFEGHDTTSVAMSWVLVLLGHHPDIQEKIFAEQDDIFQDNPNRRPTTHDLNNMKYLEMVIKEALRLYPSVPGVSRRVTKEIEVGGYTVPEGCTILLNIRQTHRDPDQWPNPERFDPDNFLPDRMQGRHPYAYVPFSAGPRNCIGQKFAILEEKSVLSYVLRNFRVETVDRLEDLKLIGELVLRPMNGVNLRLQPR
ncbi:cytochrome P450 4C1-like isoform X1 [Schistocerca serialis cubense]|uniref:cytochrome P450 4C1-like isoform X1 n=1 Tax=Schistocerca serialis cubense TaxID=2023355 RepID=UPI00214EF596|nr:cytochrome P450 4C1-like isoform X1 [Schistocerca serialis cubense]